MADTYADYAAIPAMNISSLIDMDVSAHYFKYRRANPRPETEALAFGIALHCAVLTPEVFAAEYVVAPDFGDCRFKEAKAARDAWRLENEGRTWLSDADGQRIENMAAAIRAHKEAKAALFGATEQTVTWTDAETGLACKGRLDVIGRRVVDLKATRDPSPWAFGRDAGRYRYHAKIVWYHDGAIAAGRLVDPEPPLIVAVQNVEPWDVAVYRVTDESMAAGRALYRRLLKTFVQCTAAAWWPGVAPEIVPLELPAWCLEGAPNPEPVEDF